MIIRPGFLTSDFRSTLERTVRRTSASHGLARRANAIRSLDDGLSCEAVAKVLYIDDDTVRGWHERWTDGGVDALASFDFKGAKRALNSDQEGQLVEEMGRRLFRTSTEVHAYPCPLRSRVLALGPDQISDPSGFRIPQA